MKKEVFKLFVRIGEEDKVLMTFDTFEEAIQYKDLLDKDDYEKIWIEGE